MKKPGKRYWTMKDCNMLLLMCNRKQEIYIKQVTVIISFHLIVHQEREREKGWIKSKIINNWFGSKQSHGERWWIKSKRMNKQFRSKQSHIERWRIEFKRMNKRFGSKQSHREGGWIKSNRMNRRFRSKQSHRERMNQI
jgi:hypothetical protein